VLAIRLRVKSLRSSYTGLYPPNGVDSTLPSRFEWTLSHWFDDTPHPTPYTLHPTPYTTWMHLGSTHAPGMRPGILTATPHHPKYSSLGFGVKVSYLDAVEEHEGVSARRVCLLPDDRRLASHLRVRVRSLAFSMQSNYGMLAPR